MIYRIISDKSNVNPDDKIIKIFIKIDNFHKELKKQIKYFQPLFKPKFY